MVYLSMCESFHPMVLDRTWDSIRYSAFDRSWLFGPCEPSQRASQTFLFPTGGGNGIRTHDPPFGGYPLSRRAHSASMRSLHLTSRYLHCSIGGESPSSLRAGAYSLQGLLQAPQGAVQEAAVGEAQDEGCGKRREPRGLDAQDYSRTIAHRLHHVGER